MNRKISFLSLVFFTFHFSFLTHAQVNSWAVGVRSPTAVTKANSIIQTKDGGYFVGGNANGIIRPHPSAYVVKLDPEGNIQWTSEPQGYCQSLLQTQDNGYVVVGYIDLNGIVDSYVYVTKLDSSGNTKWSQAVGGINNEYGYSIIQARDGGYAITGNTSSFLLNTTNIYVIKLDSTGNLQWTKTIGGTSTTSEDEGYSIIQTKDNGYAMAGITTSYGAGNDDVYVIKLDSTGNLQWTRTIGGRKNDIGKSIIQCNDDGFAITGITYSYADTVQGDVYIVKLDSVGNLLWTKTIGGPGEDIGLSVVQTNNGGYSIAGITNSFGIGGNNAYIIKLDSSGNLSKTIAIDIASAPTIVSVNQIKNGGFAVAGHIPDMGGFAEFFVGVFDSAGNNCSTFVTGGVIDSGGIINSGGTITRSDSGRVIYDGARLSVSSGTVNYLCSQNSSGLLVTPALDFSSCKNFPDGSINLDVSGGISPYTYSWVPSVSDSSSATGLNGGIFTITVKDSVNDSVTMIIPLLFSPNLAFFTNITNTTCRGNANGSITLSNFSGTPPYTYSWSNGGTTIADSGLSAGTYSVIVFDSCGDMATASVFIPLTSDLNDSISFTTPVICYGDSNGMATVTTSAGTPPFTYLWNDRNSQTTATASGLKAGIYSVIVSDTCGGTVTASVTITQPAIWLVSTTIVNNISCYGETNGEAIANFTVPLIANYYFEPVVQHFTVPPSVTTITLTATGAKGGGEQGGNGATFTGSCHVTPGDVISVAVGQEPGSGFGGGGASWVYDSNVVLYNPIGTTGLIAVAAGGGGEGSFYSTGNGIGSYFGGPGGDDLFANSTTTGGGGSAVGGTGGNGGINGTYGGGGAGWLSDGHNGYYTYDSGGIDEANHYIMFYGNGGFGGGGATAPYTMAGHDGTSGGGGGGYNGGGAGGYGTGGGGGGSYFVNTLPIVSDSGTGNGFVRIYYTITGYDSTYSYHWSNGETSYIATGLSEGTYSLTVSNINGCTATTSVTITQPNLLSISATVISTITCYDGNNGSASSAASGGISPYTYLWSYANSQTTITATGLSAGTYTVTLTDSNGCTASAFINITQPTAIVPTITLYSGIKCNGDSDAAIFANATGGSGFYEYQWSGATSQTNAVATGLSTGTYTILVTDNNGCSGTASITLTQPPVFSIIADSINAASGNCNGSAWVIVNGGTNPYSYLWTGGLTTDTISNQCTNYYCCTISDANGCVDSACINIDVSTGGYELAMNEGQLAIYPNPNDGQFIIDWTGFNGPLALEIYNVFGQNILMESLNETSHKTAINLSAQPNGVYFYRVMNALGALTGEGKLILQK